MSYMKQQYLTILRHSITSIQANYCKTTQYINIVTYAIRLSSIWQ